MAESRQALGVVFPANMGNRGQNVFSVSKVFKELVSKSTEIEFVGYHRRISGNFVFRYNADREMQKAASVAEEVLGLECLARSFVDLTHVDSSVPSVAEVVRGSVVVRTQKRVQRVIFVGLSTDVPLEHQARGVLTPKIEVITWPSARDVLCLYDRPGAAGDVGQVTQAVVKGIPRPKTTSQLYGSWRAMSVVRDLL